MDKGVCTVVTNNQMSELEMDIIDFITSYIKDNGYAPTVREIGEGIGISGSATMQKYLNQLADKGFIKKTPGVSRSIIVTSNY